MCHTSTPYHSACAHYGSKKVSLYCIKGLTQAGHSRGCDEIWDLGVENAAGVCTKCSGGFGCREQWGSMDSLLTPSINNPRANASRSNSNASTASSSSRVSRSEAASYARGLLASLPASIPTVRRNASGVGLPPSPTETHDSSTLELPPTSGTRESESASGLFKTERSGSNQHWRAFDGRGFEERAVPRVA